MKNIIDRLKKGSLDKEIKSIDDVLDFDEELGIIRYCQYVDYADKY